MNHSSDISTEKRILRKEKIRARESLTEEERVLFSQKICHRITGTPEYRSADIIFIYKWVKGEVKLDDLEDDARRDGKRIVYPLCVSKTEMAAVEPGDGEEAWKDSGSFGIREPDPEKGMLVEPEEIDLIICPCSAFDEHCRRLGMGGGFYDRYLPLCTNAKVIAAAFEVQKADEIPADASDCRTDAVITEAACYTCNYQEQKTAKK